MGKLVLIASFLLCSSPCFAVCRPNEIADIGACETLSDYRAAAGLGTTAIQSWTMPSCSGATTDKLLYNTSTSSFVCGIDQGGVALGDITDVFNCSTGDCSSIAATV